MWLFTKHGFYSVVCGLKAPKYQQVDPDLMVVRARNRQHLVNLVNILESTQELRPKIEHSPERDYAYRILLPKANWISLASYLSYDIDYDNFKDKVSRKSEHRLYEKALHAVWWVMFRFQRT